MSRNNHPQPSPAHRRRAPQVRPPQQVVEVFGGFAFSGMVWALIVAAVMHVVLTNTRWGVYTFATGGNAPRRVPPDHIHKRY
jgi:ribose/xylose/arabinose/galactoside ABC-type transport system permease subunit